MDSPEYYGESNRLFGEVIWRTVLGIGYAVVGLGLFVISSIASFGGAAVRAITVDLIGHGMSQPDSDTGGPPDDPITERVLQQDEFATDLNAKGYTDVLVLRRENGRDVLTDSRLAIIQHLDQEGERIESVSDLARQLDRDKGAVSKDLRHLSELDVIAYEGEGDGEAKRPFLKHEHVAIEPVVY